ncbi:BA14K family protein [Stappia sp. ICDLI1TA098]
MTLRLKAGLPRLRRWLATGALAAALCVPASLAPQSAAAQGVYRDGRPAVGVHLVGGRHHQRGGRNWGHRGRGHGHWGNRGRHNRGWGNRGWGNRGWGNRNRYYRPYRPYRYDPGPGIALGIMGLATGAIIGQSLNSGGRDYIDPPVRVHRARPAPWTPDWYAYCARKYRSFNPETGYFLAYSGRYRFCR